MSAFGGKTSFNQLSITCVPWVQCMFRQSSSARWLNPPYRCRTPCGRRRFASLPASQCSGGDAVKWSLEIMASGGQPEVTYCYLGLHCCNGIIMRWEKLVLQQAACRGGLDLDTHMRTVLNWWSMFILLVSNAPQQQQMVIVYNGWLVVAVGGWGFCNQDTKQMVPGCRRIVRRMEWRKEL